MSTRFTRLYEEHVAAVYGYLAYRLGSRAEAERLTEATFERALGDGEGSDATRVWLLTIARRLTGERDRRPGTEEGGLGISPELARALARLDRGPRSVIALRFGAGLEGDEIASVLDLSPGRVRRLLSQGIRRLRTELEREDASDLATESDPQRGDEEQSEARPG